MATKNTRYSLRVLSGENVGAQIALEPNVPIVVGKSAACNVIFNNEDVADRHVKLVLSDGRVRLRPLAQPVYVEGKDIGLHDATLLPYQLVTIGKVGFSIGDGSGQWPRVDLQGRQYQLELDDSTKNVNKSTTGSGWKIVLFWLGIAILIAANLHYFTRDEGGIFSVFGLKETVEKKVYNVVSASGLPDISISKTPSGHMQVRGYVETNEQKQRLISAILDVQGNVSHTIWVNKAIENNALLIAQTLSEEQLHFSSKGNGVLIVSGYTQSQANWRRLRVNLLEDIEGIESINDTQIKPMLERLKEEVQDQGLAETITLKQKNKKFMISGDPTPEQIKKWNKLLEKVIKPVGGYWEVVEKFDTPTNSKEFKLSLRSVSIGEVPFIVSKDGKKYLEGAHLGEDYYINKIMADKVLLKHNGTEIPIYFGKKGDLK
ncbi:MAG: type III secretion system inner membrane ring subunit SctD [Cocleimonas sp.]|nr:type III secretion system inner membrane ring subunit SctD [Cocleimonas sp.]